MSCFSAPLLSPPSVPRSPTPPKTLAAAAAAAAAGLSPSAATRRVLLLSAGALISSTAASPLFPSPSSASPAATADFFEIPSSGGVKALDLRAGAGDSPIDGDQVAIHYYGRLAAKQGWRFDSTYDHKDEMGGPIPFEFAIGSGKLVKCKFRKEFPFSFYKILKQIPVISGIESAVKSMKVGGILRVIIPPSQGYQNTSQEPLPPNVFDRQRLFTTIFNPTRLANGEGSTLGTLIFDIELVRINRR